MKIYYFNYRDGDGHFQLEAFGSSAKAKARLSELKRRDKDVRTLWKAYIIAKHTSRPQPKPDEKPSELPQQVSEFDFENKSKDAVIASFIRAIRVGRLMQ